MARKKETENEGGTADKVAKASAPPTPPAKPKRAKLPPKNKHRLPRKLKKAQKKAAATL
ncbi:MAG: hypothetical protein P4L56_15835 [Candidatus Sulfopaludibacter sp.]|nr:hypothetical protein [Candidatus Sulfopaludibacter sp.]